MNIFLRVYEKYSFKISTPGKLNGQVSKSLLQVGCFLDLAGLSLHCFFCGFQLEKTKHLFASLNFMYELLIASIAAYLKIPAIPLLTTYVTSLRLTPH